MLNDHVQSIKHKLKDSQQLLQNLENLRTNENFNLYTGYFSSLYTSMRPDYAIDSISNYIYTETNILNEFKMTLYGFKNNFEANFHM